MRFRPKAIWLITAFCFALFLAWLAVSLWMPGGKNTEARKITIPADTSLFRAVEILGEEKILSRSDRTAFVIAATLTGWRKKLQPGCYQLSSTMSAWEVLWALAHGKTLTIQLTIPEGYTLRQIGELLEAHGVGTADEFINLTTEEASSFVTPFSREGASLEGYLFPDTYQIDSCKGQAEMVRKMLARFGEIAWQQLFHGNSKQGERTLGEVLILASLVEGEARGPQERARIAGVLMNRLRKGMKLECDATVQYALGDHKPRLTFDDLKIPSPYNTYLYPGLPPGPINNPGRASIEAAMQPEKNPYFFYVARADGSHIFSRTFAEHRAAIESLRRNNHAG